MLRKGLIGFLAHSARGNSSCGVVSRGYITITEVQKQNSAAGVFFYDKQMNPISPWHQIALKADGNNDLYNMVVEIPKFTTAKMEIDTKSENNPIIQDEKNGKPRFYHGAIYWNYGALPQTWEDPNVKAGSELEEALGDNDPIDVVEVGMSHAAPAVGEVLRVKVIGGLALIDEGELDWKILAIREGDDLFSRVNDVADLERISPGVVSGVREWFRWYKTPDNKPLNRFGLKERAISAAEMKSVIAETHEHYKALMDGRVDPKGLWTACKRA